ncbi:DUF1826 domain-containing protein [SAR86 cluster bacterium]|nr:DUF1826 domain-containing protein [SAR86 cluster bacterium]
MMNAVIGDQLSCFSDIHLDDVELVSVKRQKFDTIKDLSSNFIKSREVLKLQWHQDLDDSKAIQEILPESVKTSFRSILVDLILESGEMLGSLVDCKKIGVKMATLRSPMCPLFHVDNIRCRMLITLCGDGTQWISNQDVDWEIFLDRENKDIPIMENADIKQLATGHWSLLKGGAWNDKFNGVVHRSPHDEKDRLILSIDPIFDL